MDRIRKNGGAGKSASPTRERLRQKAEGGGNYIAGPKPIKNFIHTGCRTLDLALGGGWAKTRIVNIVGDKSTGKTLLCIEAGANFIRQFPKGIIRYRESEHAFDAPYARAVGMPLDRVDFGAGVGVAMEKATPIQTVEDMFEDCQRVIEQADPKVPELYVVDSLDALSDREEMGRDMNEGTYGTAKAKKMSQLFRRLTSGLEEKGITMIIVSQVRSKIGISFGRSTTRSGGRALDFYATQVVYLAHLGNVVQTVRGLKRPVAVKIKAKVDKNKVGLPFRDCEFKIRFGFGVDDVEACVDFLRSIKSLDEVGLKRDADTKTVNNYLDDVADMTRADYEDELARLHAAVDKHWYSIDQSLMPTRGKYSD